MSSFFSRAVVYGLIITACLLSALPNVLPEAALKKLPDWYTSNHVTKGLDLQGGSHLLLAVDDQKLQLAYHQAVADQLTDQFRNEGIRFKTPEVSERGFVLTPLDPANLEKAAHIVKQYNRSNTETQAPYQIDVGQNSVKAKASDALTGKLLKDAVDRSLEVVRRRLDETGMVEPNIARQGKDSILVQLPGVDDPAHVKKLLGTTAAMQFHWVANNTSEGTFYAQDANSDQRLLLEKRIALEGKHVKDASLAFNPDSGEPVVNFKLDREGARAFGDMTTNNVGRALAIVLDEHVITAPVIRSPITGGSGEISGAFTTADAHDLALLLRAGALPAPLEVIEERTVGPDLGSDAISKGITSGLVGAVLVLIFMVGIYGRWGLIACIGLSINVGMIFGVLSLLGATMTLPGIAGLILVTGMAVDANILINERIREETRRGASAVTALKNGFHKAYSTILDSNITTLIAICLLFLFGSGPIRGFAVTMAVGIILSMFTAISVTRLIMENRVNKLGRKPLDITEVSFVEKLTGGKTIHFMKGRFIGLGISAALSLASLGLMMSPGMQYGIDFNGGSVLEIRAPEVAIGDLRSKLQENHIDAAIQEFGDQGHYLIRLPLMTGDVKSSDAQMDLVKSSVQEVDESAEFLRVEVVGPRVSGDFSNASLLAILISSVGMMAYLWIRFESHFAVSAIVTLALDLTKTIGFFVITGLEFNLTAVAALLALIGYSVNDKIVVFDRVRENLRFQPDKPLIQVFDESITSTLSRTLFTSMSTFLAIVPMAIFGGSAVESFALPMLFGIVVGTSSSIWIASPIVLLLGERRMKKGLSQLHKSKEERDREIDALP